MQAKFVSPLHEAAYKLAEAGTPVFPCLPGSKKPATFNGFKDASTSLEQIDAWWTENPEYNLAFSPHDVGLSVVDLDGPVAHEEWADREIQHGFHPETYAVLTPRPGGQHLYYRGELPPTQHKLGPHIDTRGRGSYALLPPSVIDARSEPDPSKHGTYRAENAHAFAAVPAWILPYLESLKKDRAGAASDVELDAPQNVARARSHLADLVARGDVAISGEGGNSRTFKLGCTLANLGVTADTARDLMAQLWNPHCLPPWEDDELDTIVQNAARYAQNEPGAWAAGSSSEVFGSLLGSVSLDEPEEPRRNRFAPMTLEELASLPPPSWLIPDLIPAKMITMFYGQPGSYKSFIVLMHALELAKAGHPVVYVAGEGASGIIQRADAWKLLHEVEGLLPFYVVGEMPWAADGEHLVDFIKAVAPVKPALVVIDTVARAMIGLNENDAKDMGTFVGFADTIKKALGAAVAVVHHSGKDDQRGPRGSAALTGAVDAAHEVKANKGTKTVEVWVRRMKDAAEREKPWTYRAQELLQSLVFIPTSASEHRELTHVEEATSPRLVGAALVRLGAVGDENAVATQVLASELVAARDDETPEARQRAVDQMARTLRARATGALEAYVRAGEGRERSWVLPAG